MSSIQPRKQRKALHQAPLHRRGRHLHAHLSEELLVKYGKRSTSLRVGDTVKVVRGKFAKDGHTGDVLGVDRTRFTITIEGVTVTKADGKSKPKPIHPSDVVITKLDLTDKKRREKLGASDADAQGQKPKAKKAKAKPEAAPESDPRARAAAKRAAKSESTEEASQ
jgi:large subunit ribosomal protein L24